MTKRMKMKPAVILDALHRLNKVAEREGKYCDANAGIKFTPQAAIAIAKNRKELEREIEIVAEVEERNREMAKKQKSDLKNLPEQKELMRSELDITLMMVSLSELEKCKDLTSEDFYDLMFMTEEGGEEKSC